MNDDLQPHEQQQREQHLLRKRYRRDKRFKLYCIIAVALAFTFLVYFLCDLAYRAYPAFQQAQVRATFRYTEMSVQLPKLLVEADVRDVVSRGALRTVEMRMTRNPRAELKVRVDMESGDPANPLDAVRPAGGVEGVTASELAQLIGPEGADEVAAELRGEHGPTTEADQPTPGVRWVWASDAVDRYMQATTHDKGDHEGEPIRDITDQQRRDFALDPEAQRAVDALRDARAARRQFNHMMGTTETRWVAAASEIDQFLQLPTDIPDDEIGRHTRLSAEARASARSLYEAGQIEFRFNTNFFTHGDSNMPEQAGIFSGAVGTLLVLVLVGVISFPVGVLTAIYLEEFAPDNKLTQMIEVNINNLAAIPSILFGLLGLAVFLNPDDLLEQVVNVLSFGNWHPDFAAFGVPRSSALVGGLTLSLMTLPIIIISSRAALRAVPDSIRLGAMAMGATRWQAVCHHVLPQSLSGIFTGTIIGLAQAIGETAPLIMIGLVAFIPDPATNVTDPTSVLPVQVFKWASNSQRGFVELTSAAILVLLAVLLSMNAVAVLLRARFEKRW